MRRSDLVILALGMAALVAGTLIGSRVGLVDALVAGPPLLRALLAGAALILGLGLLGEAVARVRADDADIGTLVRGVRLVFLAVGAFAAAAGWLVGHPLPIVLALLVAGVDVVETTFLLLLIGTRRVAERVRRD
jgi:CHASE2 domain-containing sensor protein